MRDDMDDQHYNTNQRLKRIQYQNDQLFQLAASTLQRSQLEYHSPPQQYYSPQRAITYSATPIRTARNDRDNEQHRRSITRRSIATNEEQIIYDDTYSTPTKNRWLDKFGM